VRSVLSSRLFTERQTLGSLNLYGVLVDVATVGSSAENQFQTALAGRDVIGPAKGILMHRDNLTGLQAFALLARVSQETNTKLVDVAKFLVGEQESRAQRPESSG
jgi:ANTAR domain